MKRRKTVDRWIADTFKTPELVRKANETDRRIDKRVGAQMNFAQDKSPETDWRTLNRMEGQK